MEIYFAPLEGITTRTYRQVFKKFYGGIDRFFSPFIVVTSDMAFKRRDKRDFLPYEENLIPQILTNDAEAFIWAAKNLKERGYEQVNINAGCPSGTVTSKGRGAGLLEDVRRLDNFLAEIFSADDLPDISIKTRAGFYDVSEAGDIARVYSKYPFCQVIVHPRARNDLYAGRPSMDAFSVMAKILKCPVCYNGDIKKPGDVPADSQNRVMIGRGLVADMQLAERIKDTSGSSSRNREFMDCLKDEYLKVLSGERDVLFKLKEIWSYMGSMYPEKEKQLKEIRKAQSLSRYDAAIAGIFS